MSLISIPANPAPDNVVSGMMKTPDGVSLRFARWAPPPGRKGTVCLFQGRAEFIEKYFETVRDLRSRGFAVATVDWRGQGLSERALSDPRKGHVRDFAQYEADLAAFVKEIVLPDCPPPFYALGHSMGASVLMRVAHKGYRWFDRIVMSAPMIELAPRSTTPFARPTVTLPEHIRLRLVLRSGRNADGRRRATIHGQYPDVGPGAARPYRRGARAEPALGLGSPTNSWASAALSVMAEFAEPGYASSIRQPIMMVAAGRDETVSTAAIEDFAGRLRAGSHLIVAGARHEMLMEQERYRAQFWAAFDAFVPGTPLYT